MSGREKDSRSLHDKFKQFFKRNPGNKTKGSFELTDDIQRDIGKDMHASHRVKRLKELNERISHTNLDTDTIAKLWSCIEDIFSKDNVELRNTGFMFVKTLVKHQNDELELMRAHFFRFIKTHNNPQDIGQRLQLLLALTNNGKNIQHFEEEIGPFLSDWFPDIQQINMMPEFLEFIVNLIKFNAICLESFVLSDLIELVCILCCNTYDVVIVNGCLLILETIIAYSNIPAAALPKIIEALCRTVNNEEYCQLSWKIGRNLLGTHMGHSALYTLCLILQEPSLKNQIYLLRGAVFFIYMSLWSTSYVANLYGSTNSILPSFLEVAKTDHPIICYEVILGVYALIQKQGADLQLPAWTVILEIIKHVNTSVENNQGQLSNVSLISPLHDTLNIIERLIDTGHFNGSIDQFFQVIECCANSRPESSILRLIQYTSRNIISTEHCWLANLNKLLNTYFKPEEVRTNIRLTTLRVLSHVASLNRNCYEEELIERIVIPHCSNVYTECSVVVRSAVAKLLLDLCKGCESKKCMEMLEIIEKLLFRPFEIYADFSPPKSEIADVLDLIEELIKVFLYKMDRLPSVHAVKMYTLLVQFLEIHYKKPTVFLNCHEARYLILSCFLKMRANDRYHLGCIKDDGTISYSPYLCVMSHSKDKTALGSPLPHSPAIGQHNTQTYVTYVSIKRAFRVFITCLEQEKNWKVLSLVLQGLPKIMKNKPLILSKYGNIELDILVDVLSPTILEKNFVLPESFAKEVKKQEYLNTYLMVLVTLPCYHACLDQKHQQLLVRCLSRCIANSLRTNPKQLVEALTICCLEMTDVMVKMLPEILLTISKISPTVVIAIPILEFLSTLTQLPLVYASFVDDQYMAVFAITSPFTNPFKYNHYTVSLAHYVIGVWFLKCRLPIRKNFVKFITRGLQTNVLTPFEETNFLNRLDLSKLNVDSSDRKRSSSLTEQGPRRRAATVSGGSGSAAASGGLAIAAMNTSNQTFYEELTETCIDLMARYAFSPTSSLPRRTPTAEFLLNGGQSASWMLGNKLITITTSGCSQKVLKHGLCDKCWNLCSNENRVARSARSGSAENVEGQKLTRQNSNEKSSNSAGSPMDDNKKLSDDKNVGVLGKLHEMVTPDMDNYEKPLCACWCQSWAEIFIRRPTGDMSWMMRVQNTISSKLLVNEFPLKDITNLFMPSVAPVTESQSGASRSRTNSSGNIPADEVTNPNKEDHYSSAPISIPGSPARNSPSRQSSKDSVEEDIEHVYDDGTKSRNPVRRSNSSPEMSNWKNPFLHLKHEDDKAGDDDGNKKSGKLYSKDMKVSCEAIPEEIAGTTPPSCENPLPKTSTTDAAASSHPSLVSYHSYPGSSPPKETAVPPKPHHTVPPSPNILTVNAPPTYFPQSNLTKNSSSDLSVESVKSEGDVERPSTLPAFSKVQNISTKPPQSPTQSPAAKLWALKDRDGNEIQKSASASVLDKNTQSGQDKNKDRKTSGSVDKLSDFEPQRRDRINTVSGTSPGVRKPRSEQLKQLNTRPREAPKSGTNPSFVFLQIYPKVDFAGCRERPLLITNEDAVRRAVSVLDQIPPYETHRIGVLYIREGQANKEAEILSNCFGSIRYGEFLRKLGTLLKLQDVDPQLFFLGGLAQDGEDGTFSYMWQDDLVKMIFHVATLMPNKETDPKCSAKKRHIGNNHVTIVYNESGEDYSINTIRSQFNFAAVIIHPMDHKLNQVTVKYKKELIDLMGSDYHQETKIVSDQCVAILARQLALHANLASLVHRSLGANSQSPYASNWLERLRQIKKIRSKLSDTERGQACEGAKSSTKSRQRQMEDFTEYT